MKACLSASPSSGLTSPRPALQWRGCVKTSGTCATLSISPELTPRRRRAGGCIASGVSSRCAKDRSMLGLTRVCVENFGSKRAYGAHNNERVMSLPARERGLKLEPVAVQIIRMVAPRAGAWIETPAPARRRRSRKLSVNLEIEPDRLLDDLGRKRVAGVADLAIVENRGQRQPRASVERDNALSGNQGR